MRYPKFKEIAIKNFMAVSDINISFEESPIVVLTANSETGKSAIIQALRVMGRNEYEREQSNWVRKGTEGFGIGIEDEDGNALKRVKVPMKGINSYVKVDPNGNTIWSSNRLDQGGEVPEEVQNFMGFIREKDTKEMLQIRTYREQEIFTETSDGTNYKIMYDALHIEHITNALKKGSEFMNALMQQNYKDSIALEEHSRILRNIKIYDIETVVKIKNQILARLSSINNLENIEKKIDDINKNKKLLEVYQSTQITDIDLHRYKQLESIIALIDRLYTNRMKLQSMNMDGLNIIDENLVENYNRATRLIDRLADNKMKMQYLSEVKNIDEIDINSFNKTVKINQLITSMSERVNVIEYYSSLDNIQHIEQVFIDRYNNILTLLDKIDNSRKNQAILLNEVEELKSELILLLKEYGDNTQIVNCEKCGHEMIVRYNL